MIDRVNIRKEAYRYIVERLSVMPSDTTRVNLMQNISLEELRQLKEGAADPSSALVALIKDELKGVVNDLEIDSHLVEPFK